MYWSPQYWSTTYWPASYWHGGATSGLVVKVNGEEVLPGGTIPIASIALGDTFVVRLENPGPAGITISAVVFSGELAFFGGFFSGTLAADGGTEDVIVQVPLWAEAPFVGLITVQSSDPANPNYDLNFNAAETVTLGVGALPGALSHTGEVDALGGTHQARDVCPLAIRERGMR